MYHIPVLLQPAIDLLITDKNGVYVDVTFGGGGHTRYLLQQTEAQAQIIAFDQDRDAVANAETITDARFSLIQANFRYLKKFLQLNGITQIDGLLADLGISSHQIDTPARGFSIRYDADLDMRMDSQHHLTAADVLNTYSEEKLHQILGMYGEVRNARTLAATIVRKRATKPLKTVFQFKEAVGHLAPKGKENRYFAQVFQALRIEVNEELEALKELLQQAAEVIKPNGRIAVISYHSLEDRLVKNFLSKGLFYGEPEKDVYGNFSTPFEPLHRKPIEADEQEVAQNNRARSAKLRVAVRTSSR